MGKGQRLTCEARQQDAPRRTAIPVAGMGALAGGLQGELAALERHLPIAGTSFFRDPETFESLKRVVFPRILEGRPANQAIRVWVVGCATGEEAFSIAISLREYLDETGASFAVRIFASDVSSRAIDKARGGRFPENIAADLTLERLNRHFTRIEGGYRVNQNLRKMCVFTRHDPAGDPPFSELDLIGCRGAPLDLGSPRKSILPLFHDALKPTGFLMLGASPAGAPGDWFAVVDREHRIYARREAARKPHGPRAEAGNAVLAQARDFTMSVVETVRQPLLVLDAQLRVGMANQAFCRAFQVSPEEAAGQLVYSLSRGGWDFLELKDSLDGLLRGGIAFPDFEVERDFPTVGHRILLVGGCRIQHLGLILLSVDDLTERRVAQIALHRSEEHLRQSQKMEAVGRLAGGIAHDFNNLLTAIIGYSDLLQDTLAGNQPAIQQVLEIKTAGERAASLTQQLLAFSRRQVLQPKVLDLNVIVGDFERMLRRLVGERIKVVVDCASGLWQVRADAGEIGRAIMNLALNARDAMPAGGTLAIETANAIMPQARAPGEKLAPGRYVTMAVRDTGVGMDAEMQAHIFELFFTTKETGKGTGLGLATVLGIVEQSGGVIRCQSELGRGTTFRIFLPAVVEALDKGAGPAAGLTKAPRGSEVVLVVEDEDAVRKLARSILEASGYMVLDARNGREGLALCEIHPGSIDLLVTDVVMPELGGRELAHAALKLRPRMRVMFMSGHAPDVVLKEGVERRTAFLRKPFVPVELARKVREVLDK